MPVLSHSISRLSLLATIGTTALVGACSDPAPREPPSFRLDISGPITKRLQGDVAVFGVDTNETRGTITWILTLSVEGENGVEGVDLLMPGLGPREGSFRIGHIDGPTSLRGGEVGAVLALDATDGITRFEGTSDSGLLTVLVDSVDAMVGSFNLTASGVLFSATSASMVRIQVSGDFRAVPGEIVAP